MRLRVAAAALAALAVRTATLLPGILLGAALLVAATPGRVRAQEPAPGDSARELAAGSVVGTVVDAGSGLPLPGARVLLSPLPLGVVPTAGASFVTTDRAVTTDSSGGYRFTGLAAGDYALHVQRMGYRPATLQLSLRASGSSLVSVGMTIVPVRLQVVEVRALADAALASDAMGTAAPGARTAVERLRQQRYLSADVRTFAAGDARESLALAETDLFRSLQRLPGVETRDVYSADLITRGARGDGTRIYFDGLPLIDPLHGQGSLSGVATEAIGTAFLHPGVRPASLGEGGAAVVDLHSRAGASDTLHGVAHVTQFSARAALDRRASSGRWAFMLAGQRTYLDIPELGVRWSGIAPPAHGLAVQPFRFFDLAARGDLRLGARSALEASAIATGDAQSSHYVFNSALPYTDSNGQLTNVVTFGNRTRSGNGAARLALATSFGGLAGRIGVGTSRYDAAIEVAPGSILADPTRASQQLPMRSSVAHSLLFASLEPASSGTPSTGAPPTWSIGSEVVRRDARFRGAVEQIFGRELTSADTTRSGALTTVALWGERRWRPVSALDVQTGLRVEGGEAVRGAGSLRVAPRLTARHQLSSATSISAGVGRVYQYSQALPPSALGLPAVTYPSRLWLVAGGDVPALRTDIVTLGGERWLGARWLASANAFARRGDGLAIADPRPGDLVDRPLFVVGGERASGFELAARRLEGRWTASLAYSYARAGMLAEGLRFTSPYERRHAVDATWMFRLRPSLRLGAAYSYSSGAPFTRTYVGGIRRPEDTGAGYEYSIPPRAEAPFAERLGSGTTADLLVDWSHAFRTWQLGAFLQLHGSIRPSQSVLYAGTTNYSPSSYSTSGQCADGTVDCIRLDMGDTPYPLVPIVGFRVSF